MSSGLDSELITIIITRLCLFLNEGGPYMNSLSAEPTCILHTTWAYIYACRSIPNELDYNLTKVHRLAFYTSFGHIYEHCK